MRTLNRWTLQESVNFGASSGAKSSKSGALQRGIEYHRRIYKLLRVNVTLGSLQGWRLLVEPWFRCIETRTLRSPDSVLLQDKLGLVVEVKKNWSDGRDEKLIDEYLPITKSAFELDTVRPLLITSNVRGLRHEPLLGLGAWQAALDWRPGQPTPVMLVP